MTDTQFNADDFASLLPKVLNRSIQNVRIIKYTARPYSHIWFLEISTKTETFPIVAKYWDSDTTFDKQVNMLHTARSAFSEDEDVCIPYIGSLRRERLLFMPQICDPTIANLCHISLLHLLNTRQIHYKKDRLKAACARAGRWLRGWHNKTAGNGELGPAFDSYLSNRPGCLELVPHRERDQLLELVGNLRADVTCIPHGDFTPLNLLWSPERLTILDFGLSEWERMTPWWDYASMEIGLSHVLQFSIKSLGAWVPSFSDIAINAFRNAYGERNSRSRARLACLAVRHLILYSGDIRNGARYRRRAKWHKTQLQKVLAEAAQTD